MMTDHHFDRERCVGCSENTEEGPPCVLEDPERNPEGRDIRLKPGVEVNRVEWRVRAFQVDERPRGQSMACLKEDCGSCLVFIQTPQTPLSEMLGSCYLQKHRNNSEGYFL